MKSIGNRFLIDGGYRKNRPDPRPLFYMVGCLGACINRKLCTNPPQKEKPKEK